MSPTGSYTEDEPLQVCRTCILSPSSCINFFPSFVHGAGVCWANQRSDLPLIRVRTLLSPSLSMSFSMTLVLAAALEIFKTTLVLVIFLFSTDVIQFNRHKLWCPQKRVSFALINYVSPSYFVLALTSAVSNLPNITSIFYHFPWPTIKFDDFLSLENEILKCHDFPGFQWPLRTLHLQQNLYMLLVLPAQGKLAL